MSIYSDAKNYSDLLHAFDELGAQLSRSREAIALLPDLDARHVAIRGLQEVVAGYAMGFSSMIYGRTQIEIIRSFGSSNIEPDMARCIVENAWKNGLLVLFMFKLDSLFQNLLKAEGSYGPKVNKFGDMVARLIAISNPSNPIQIRDVLLTAAAIRNSHHNNGIHRNLDLEFDILGMNFRLIKDQAVDCASWPHILAILSAALATVDEMLASAAIAALPFPIPDQYAQNPVD